MCSGTGLQWLLAEIASLCNHIDAVLHHIRLERIHQISEMRRAAATPGRSYEHAPMPKAETARSGIIHFPRALAYVLSGNFQRHTLHLREFDIAMLVAWSTRFEIGMLVA
jgi:hypothetical protein